MHLHKVTNQLTQEPLSQWQDSYRRNVISRPSIILATKKGKRTERRVMKPNLKTRITATQAPQVHTLEKLQHLKIQALTAMDLVLVHMPLMSPHLMFDRHNLYKIYWQYILSVIPSGVIPMHVMSQLIP